MKAFPHHYRAQATAARGGVVRTGAEGVPELDTHAPPEFGGPPGHWSPETLLVAAVANCFILTFRAVARSSHLDWLSLSVAVEGVLERVDGVTRFTRFFIRPRLHLADGQAVEQAHTALSMAEQLCLVTNSLNAAFKLEAVIEAEPLLAT
ncbi:MAG: OsmC family protein [Burkholderiales bacterium]|nr:OsmC family protein [Burkholderiales bacterium]